MKLSDIVRVLELQDQLAKKQGFIKELERYEGDHIKVIAHLQLRSEDYVRGVPWEVSAVPKEHLLQQAIAKQEELFASLEALGVSRN